MTMLDGEGGLAYDVCKGYSSAVLNSSEISIHRLLPRYPLDV